MYTKDQSSIWINKKDLSDDIGTANTRLFRVFRLVRHLFRAAFRVRPGAHFFARVHLSVGIHVISTHELLQAYRFGRLAGTVGCALRADAGGCLVDTVEASAGSVEARGTLF